MNFRGRQIGQYEIIDIIGKGGMATVYRARQPRVQREVAIKVIKPELTDREQFLRRFEREAQMIAGMAHPFILKLFDYGEEQDVIYLVMELLTGGSLATLIRRGPLPLTRAARLIDQISSALDYAHERGIVHRDLKPQNILLDEKGNAILTDFGIAKLLGVDQTSLTQTGVSMGTPSYMAPEQWQGLAIDLRTDIYAFGVVIYEMLIGRLPFSADTPFALMHMHIYQPPPSLREGRSDIPLEVEQIIRRALAKNPDERFSSAGDLGEAFKEAIQTNTVRLMRTPTPAPAPVAPPESPKVVDPEITGTLTSPVAYSPSQEPVEASIPEPVAEVNPPQPPADSPVATPMVEPPPPSEPPAVAEFKRTYAELQQALADVQYAHHKRLQELTALRDNRMASLDRSSVNYAAAVVEIERTYQRAVREADEKFIAAYQGDKAAELLIGTDLKVSDFPVRDSGNTPGSAADALEFAVVQIVGLFETAARAKKRWLPETPIPDLKLPKAPEEEKAVEPPPPVAAVPPAPSPAPTPVPSRPVIPSPLPQKEVPSPYFVPPASSPRQPASKSSSLFSRSPGTVAEDRKRDKPRLQTPDHAALPVTKPRRKGGFWSRVWLLIRLGVLVGIVYMIALAYHLGMLFPLIEEPPTGRVVYSSWGKMYSTSNSSTENRNTGKYLGNGYCPEISPDGLMIAYSTGSVYVMGASASSGSLGAGQFPSWSPDGQYIVYQANPTGRAFTGISFISYRGGTPITVTTNSSDRLPKFTSDGSRISFLEGGGLYTVRIDGTDRQHIPIRWDVFDYDWSPSGLLVFSTADRIYKANGDGSNATEIYHGELAVNRGLAWSPDSRYIMYAAESKDKPFPNFTGFIREFSVEIARPDLWYVSASGGTPKRLTRDYSEKDCFSWGGLPGQKTTSVQPTTVATAAPQSVSAASGRIAFSSVASGKRRIFVMNASGSGRTQLAGTGSDDGYPTWSPDGRQIAFISNRNGPWNIYVMTSTGLNAAQRTTFSGGAYGPAWSPDGAKIVFYAVSGSDNEIYVMNADGSGLKQLTSNSVSDHTPAWSPDGRYIVYTSVVSGRSQIFVMDVDGSNRRQLTTASGDNHSPAWSPDGAKIAFVSSRDGNNEIYILDGTSQRRLTNSTASDYEPTWSSDGKWIAFVSTRDGDPEIFLMQSDGSNVRKLTSNTAEDIAPEWSRS